MGRKRPLQNDRNHRLVGSGKRKVESIHRLPLPQRRERVGVRGVLLALVLITLSAGPLCAKPALYDVDASGADIRYVLEALAQRSGLSIVVSPEVTGPLTAHLKQLPIDAILDSISVCQGFAWQKSGSAYLVGPKERLNPPETTADAAPAPVLPPPPPPEKETLVWTCKHVRPDDLTATVTKLFPSIKVAEGPSPVTPVLAQSSYSAGGSSGSSSGSSSSSSAPQSASTMVVLIGDPVDIAKARDMIRQIDIPRQQVSIQVAITEISSSANKELGIDWSWSDLVLKEAAPESGIAFGKFAKEGMTFTGVISALGKDGSANLLAQPNISVVDGECADILIGERILFPKLVGYTQFGTPIYDKEEERVGIYLQIAPRVTGDEIVMTLYPQISLVTSYLKTQAGEYPQISTREAKTTVSVKNGATLAIGGLLRDDEIREASKIPLLGDIPVLGQLFRHTKKTKQRTEIVIFLTPKLQPSEQAPSPGKPDGQ